MSPDPDYPRWMFHSSLEPVIVESPAEEAALGVGWRRTIGPPPPLEEKAAAPKRGRPPIDRQGEVRNVHR